MRMLASASVHLRRAGFTIAIEETGPAQLDAVARRRTWGDEDFLVRLASLDLTDTPQQQPARRSGSRGPVIALLGRNTSYSIHYTKLYDGPGSRAAHVERGYAVLTGDWPGLARDVDVPDHLDDLALGPRTREFLRR